MPLHLKNPHSILAALGRRPADVIEVRLPPRGGEAWDAVRENAVRLGVTTSTSHSAGRKPSKRRGRSDTKSERSSAGEAVIRALSGVSLGELFDDVPRRAGGRGLWLALDCLQDPHNLGAIFRTAAFFGVQGIILTADRSAPLSGVAYDTAAGGVEFVPFAMPVNLGRALEVAREAGVWILGSSEHAEHDVATIPRDRPWLLVIGNEARGLRRMTLERCDQLCCIRARGSIRSLNASVAAGILMAALVGPSVS